MSKVIKRRVASRPALKNMNDEIKLIKYTENLTYLILFADKIVLTKSTSIWFPVFNSGPNIGKTNQLTSAGGSSINQSKP